MSAVRTGGGDQDGVYKAEITINAIYIPDWILLSNADKKKVITEKITKD